jgi:hypothetical protein
MKYTKEFLISELQRVYNKNNYIICAHKFLKSNNLPHSSVFTRYFGSWNTALQNAGLPINEERNEYYKKYTKEFLISELQRYYKETNEIPTTKTIKKYKPLNQKIYSEYFGSWNNAIKEAGFTTFNERTNKSQPTKNKIKKENIFSLNNFIKNKYYNWYYGIINNAINQHRTKSKTQYYEKHHIIPKSLEGDNSKDNLVLLTAREHFICHYLLIKMLPENTNHWYSIVKAFNMMKSSPNTHKNKRYFNSRLYDYTRKHIIITLSTLNSGIKNPNFGKTKVYHSWLDIQPKSIPATLLEEYIAQGWYGHKGWQPKLSWE